MKLLLDQGLPHSAPRLLCQIGYDAIHVSEIGMSASSDVEILFVANRDGRCAITLDADFHAILADQGSASPSVIRLRIEGLKSVELCAILDSVIQKCTEELLSGAAVVVQPGRIRVRKLPIHS